MHIRTVRSTSILLLLLAVKLHSFGQEVFDYKKDIKIILAMTKDSASPLSYSKLLPKFLAKDTSMHGYQMLALLIGFTDQEAYNPYEDIETEKSIFDLNEAGNYEDALDQSAAYIKKHPLSLRILKERSFAFYQQKQQDSADYYMDLVDKIMEGMAFSGKGLTADKPMFALGLDDGEHFMKNVGMVITNRATGNNQRGDFMEIVNGMKEDGSTKIMYFLIQHAYNKMDGDYSEVSTKKPKKGKPKKEKTADKKSKADKNAPASTPAPAAAPAAVEPAKP